MEELEVVAICKKVLASLVNMAPEGNKEGYKGQLIFPNKIQKGEGIKRISEQELRQLFIEKFNEDYKNLYYSIETPTTGKYNFKEVVKVDEVNGQSALLDMSVLKGSDPKLNIEFKHGNPPLKNIEKDVLKLMHEEQNGAFIFLLKNTNSGTLCNSGNTGVLDKLLESFEKNEKNENNWRGKKDKFIQLIILSLEQKSNGTPILIHRVIRKGDLDNLEKLFSINSDGCGNITTVSKESGWNLIPNNLKIQ